MNFLAMILSVMISLVDSQSSYNFEDGWSNEVKTCLIGKGAKKSKDHDDMCPMIAYYQCGNRM